MNSISSENIADILAAAVTRAYFIGKTGNDPRPTDVPEDSIEKAIHDTTHVVLAAARRLNQVLAGLVSPVESVQ